MSQVTISTNESASTEAELSKGLGGYLRHYGCSSLGPG